ncbi:MAG: hypothetical protein HJJLKODD_01017 [Phycisphaerae bacterium]|nr:hypothetical protein [Phycisphaerae bacterium]
MSPSHKHHGHESHRQGKSASSKQPVMLIALGAVLLGGAGYYFWSSQPQDASQIAQQMLQGESSPAGSGADSSASVEEEGSSDGRLAENGSVENATEDSDQATAQAAPRTPRPRKPRGDAADSETEESEGDADHPIPGAGEPTGKRVNAH